MKHLVILGIILFFAVSLTAQPIIDVGVKAGINKSKISDYKDFSSESVLKSHFGAFVRLGYGRLYVQPEAYYSAKGADFKSGIEHSISKFNFKNVDVPILLGVKVLKGGIANVRVMGGPVFSFITSKNVKGDTGFTKDYFKDHYFGFQYGLGVDVWKFFLDARFEQSTGNFYKNPDFSSKNRTFLVTAGIKIF
jgi:hypothetical protein